MNPIQESQYVPVAHPYNITIPMPTNLTLQHNLIHAIPTTSHFVTPNYISPYENLQMPREIKIHPIAKKRSENPYEILLQSSYNSIRPKHLPPAIAIGIPKHTVTYNNHQLSRNSPSNGILNSESFDKITEEICLYHSRNAQTELLYQYKLRLRNELYISMKEVFPFCGLYIVGSSMNGFGSNISDMDLCLMLSHEEIDQKRDATEILYLLYGALQQCNYLNRINLIKATVPILKFIDTISKVECDLNINNSVGIRNTHLMNAYSRLDVRLAPLVIFVKHWAKVQNINDAKEGTISSFSLVLMVIHFMQCGCNPNVIISLQEKYPQKYNTYRDIRLLTLSENKVHFKSPNKQSVGELFVGFLRYYSQEFDFENCGISVRKGRILPRHVIAHQDIVSNNPLQWKDLCIEEPFNLSNTARSVHNTFIFQKIKRVFRISYERITNTANLHSIIDNPL